MYFKQFVEEEGCPYFLVCAYLVLAVDGVKYSAAGMSTLPLATL